jgi:hypothetical protein
MIKDNTALKNLRSEWETVRSIKKIIAENILSAFHTSHGFMSADSSVNKFAYSLLLLFATSVLEHVLLKLRDEGRFACDSSNLGPIMAASRTVLPWINYPLVDQARDERNKIAHEQLWIEQADCYKYIDAIEAELISWNIVLK